MKTRCGIGLGKISKQGDQYLRWQLIVGAMSVIRQAKRRGTSNMPWFGDMIARIIWALMKQGGTYQKSLTVPAT